MRNTFPGYYRPTKEEFTELWENCLFVLDASVLLDLYRYSSETSEELIQILGHISERLWTPHQAAFEYQKNRLNVIAKQRQAYSEIEGILIRTKDRLANDLRQYGRHPLIDVKRFTKSTEKMLSRMIKELKTQEAKHPDLHAHDSVRDEVTSLFNKSVGEGYSRQRIEEIFKEGQSRYDRDVPPGYSDGSTKEGEEKFGDLVLWFEIMDMAKEVKKPIIFVTDDTKEDWWWKFEGKTIGPRPELVQEIREKAGVLFYMYRPDSFMEYARDYLNQKIDQKAIDEIRSLGQEKELVLEKLRQKIADLDAATVMLDNVTNERSELQGRVTELEKKLEDTIIGRAESLDTGRVADIARHHEELPRLHSELVTAEDRLHALRKQQEMLLERRRMIRDEVETARKLALSTNVSG